MQELRGTTSRQDAEVRHLRDENRDLAQKAALVEVLGADCASLKQQASSHTRLQQRIPARRHVCASLMSLSTASSLNIIGCERTTTMPKLRHRPTLCAAEFPVTGGREEAL